MAKKKKGNMKNIQPGATVQFLNYLTPDHILRGKYNIGNNELDITDVPANLNSVITLGQGGGGSNIPIFTGTYTVTMASVYPTSYENGIWTDLGEKTISSPAYICKRTYTAMSPDNNDPSVYVGDQLMTDYFVSVSDPVNCEAVENGGYYYIKIIDPTKDSSATVEVEGFI